MNEQRKENIHKENRHYRRILLVGVIWLVLQSVYAWNSRTGMPAAAG